MSKTPRYIEALKGYKYRLKEQEPVLNFELWKTETYHSEAKYPEYKSMNAPLLISRFPSDGTWKEEMDIRVTKMERDLEVMRSRLTWRP